VVRKPSGLWRELINLLKRPPPLSLSSAYLSPSLLFLSSLSLAVVARRPTRSCFDKLTDCATTGRSYLSLATPSFINRQSTRGNHFREGRYVGKHMRDPLKDHYCQHYWRLEAVIFGGVTHGGSAIAGWSPATLDRRHTREEKRLKKAGVLPFDSARCVRDNRSPAKRIAVWQAIGISAHPVVGRRIVAATVIGICSFPLSLLAPLSSFTLSSSHRGWIRASTRQQARVNAKPGCLPWRGARLISRAKPAGSKDIGTDCFRLCCSPVLSKRPTGTLVRFLIKPAL